MLSHKTTHTIFMCLVFASFGITVEVFFTAFMSLVNQTPLCNKPMMALAGMSYVWMALIYAAVPILGVLFYDKVKHINIFVRLPLYVFIIYIFEFTSGYLLRITTGSCPWNYTSGWHIMGLIRLDYFPAWLLFAFLVERLYVYMSVKMIR